MWTRWVMLTVLGLVNFLYIFEKLPVVFTFALLKHIHAELYTA